MKIGKGLKLILERKGISQKQLSNMVKISETSISQIIQNNKYPKKETLEKIAFALDTKPEVLAIMSIELEDVPQERKELFKSIWPSYQETVLSIFTD